MILQRPARPAQVADANGQDAASPQKGGRYRVLVVEDHPLFCDGLRMLFEREQEFELVGEARTGASALAMARHYQPALILLDIGLPDTSGLDLVNQLLRLCPDVKLVIITGHPGHEYLKTALRLGVHAFLQKDTSGPAILEVLRSVVHGERVVGQPRAMSVVLREFGQLLRERERERFGLTDQEIVILKLAAAGLNNKDIGAQQFWSEITIKRKMQDIYRKMDVKSRAQAVAEAIRLGII